MRRLTIGKKFYLYFPGEPETYKNHKDFSMYVVDIDRKTKTVTISDKPRKKEKK